jgi:phosphoribosyl 1,2-cyclic phosphodiesterase
LNVTFYGVRGSTPCSCESNRRYGGNTACVALELPGLDPIVLDLGTGLRFWGADLPVDEPFHGHALVTHLHWDHVQGLPFFTPVLRPESSLDIYAPAPDSTALAVAFDEFMSPPYFPVRVADLPGELRFHAVAETEFAIGDAKVTARSIPHIGATNGYRVERDGVAVVYISDHQQPVDGSMAIPDGVLELCENADLLIHDAQFTASEFVLKSDWGHCTVDFALAVAAQAGVRRLALFHHDTGHDDVLIDSLLLEAREKAAKSPIGEIIAASEGLSLSLRAARATAR